MQPIIQSIGRAKLVFTPHMIGSDHVITLTGGQEHVGAAAVGSYDEKSRRASASVITLPGHRDDEIALYGADRISAAAKTATVFIVGIHLDNITADEISGIVAVSKQMVDTFIASL